MPSMDLTNEQWQLIEPLLPPLPRRADGRGRPWNDPRRILDGILWVLVSGARWKDMPDRYPPYQTCHRWFQGWVKNGVLERAIQAIAAELEDRGGIDLSECFIDGTFSPAKKGGSRSGRRSEEKAPRSWPSSIVRDSLSPSTLQALRRMRASWSTTPSTLAPQSDSLSA